MKYVKAEAEVVKFDNTDVIATSQDPGSGSGGGCNNYNHQSGGGQKHCPRGFLWY